MAKKVGASATGGQSYSHGAIVRGDSSRKKIALVFTADEFAEGGGFILQALREQKLKASFFLTGNFYRNKQFAPVIRHLLAEGHYLGAHSNKHLLYCDWNKRDSLLVSRSQFEADLLGNYESMEWFGIGKDSAHYFLPPFEWYNDTIAAWTKALGLQLINFTPGTLSHADYTWPNLANYRSSQKIIQSILTYESKQASGLNGFILLMHMGTDPKRSDKLYRQLPKIIKMLKNRGYTFCRVDRLLRAGSN